MNSSATSTGERDRLLDHEYDGIREYDNPLPGWWVYLFYATIVFSLGYFAYYELGPGPSILARYEEEVRLAAAREGARPAPADAVSEEALRALAQDRTAMAGAQQVFTARCAACHGPAGQGLIGPNLADDYWIHGTGRLTDILKVVSDGVPDKGMVPWKGVLKPGDLHAVAAYVGTLRGTTPPNPKPPQGTKVSEAPPLLARSPGR